jgi:hypothetical protein
MKKRVWYRIENRKKWLVERLEEIIKEEKVKGRLDHLERNRMFYNGQLLGLEIAQKELEKPDAQEVFLE